MGLNLLQSLHEATAPQRTAEGIDMAVPTSEAGCGATLLSLMAKYAPFLPRISERRTFSMALSDPRTKVSRPMWLRRMLLCRRWSCTLVRSFHLGWRGVSFAPC